MAAAILLLHSRQNITADDAEAFRRVERAFPPRIRDGTPRRLRTSQMILAVWSHDASRCAGLLADERTGHWIALVGNPARLDLRDVEGDPLLEQLLLEFTQQRAEFVPSLSPPFAVVLGDGATGRIQVFVDPCGLQHLYVGGQDRTWISSSSLALSSAVRAGVDRDAVAEWATTGHFLSNRTFLQGVLKISAGERLLIHPDRGMERRVSAQARGRSSPPRSVPEQAYVDAFLSSLRASGSDHGLSNELTGGLDSRLVLAGLLHAGEPSLSWTFGAPGCREMRTIERLQKRVSFPHLFVPIEDSFADDIVDLAREMHALSDGEVNALEYAPLLLAFRGLDGRRVTSLSGAGGEIARGFYDSVLRAGGAGIRGVPLQGLLSKVTAFTSVLAPALREDLFPDPLAETSRVLQELIETSAAGSPEAILDDIYLRARMQRFAGRNFSTTGLFCRQGLPYFGNDFVEVVQGLPMWEKEGGRAARNAVVWLSPSLASVPLDSGMRVRLPGPDGPGVLARGWTAVRRKTFPRRAGSLAALPGTVPWPRVRQHRAFGAFARDLLCSRSSSVREYFAPDHVDAIVRSSLEGAALFPLGILLTLELTLRRVADLRLLTAPPPPEG